ncbi:FecR domain-containing protein [Planctomycetota bacterium]
MDEPKSPEGTPLVELIELVLQGTASDDKKRQLQARLAASPEDRKAYLHHLNLHSALRRQFAFDGEEEMPARPDLASRGQTSEAEPRGAKSWAAVAAAVVVAIAALYFQQPNPERPIAKVTGLSGPLQWTGDGGRVSYDLSVGAELPGGTVEGMAPRSWFELTFNDGSRVTISGNSTLTVSDDGQKKLHLKEGNVSANVNRQPVGKPMLIYTRSAMLEVLGTQFDVQAGLTATMLNVSKGTVRIKRLSDDNTVDVHARQRVTAAADREMSPVPIPDSVSRWKSQLHLGPAGSQGNWSPATDTRDARLRAIPYTTPQGQTIYTTGLAVSRGDRPPVILHPASRLRVRGRIASPHVVDLGVYFGVTLRDADGEFAGRFQTIRPAVEFPSGQEFEMVLRLRDFQLDPSLDEMKNKLPGDPFDLVVETFWCHTLDKQAGLEIAEVELIPPVADESE